MTCHLLVSTSATVAGYKKDKRDTEKLLGVKFDKKLTFDNHLPDICIKASRKTFSLARVTPYMGIAKKHILISPRSLVIAVYFGCAIVGQITT